MRQKIVEISRELVDVPWQHQGRNMFGIDCVGFLIWVGIKAGYEPIDIIDYSRFYNPKVLIKAFKDNGCRLVSKANIIPGDITIIKVGRSPMHVGILSMKYGVKHIIHAYEPAGKVLEEELHPVFEKRIYFGFAFPEL